MIPRLVPHCSAIFSLLLVLAHALGAIFNDVQLDTIALRQGDPRLGSFPNHKDVFKPCRKAVPCTILEVDDLERAWVTLTGLNCADTANTVSSRHHCNVSNFEFDVIEDLATVEIKPH